MNTEELWSGVCDKLKAVLNKDTFSCWISIITPVEFKEDQLVLSVENDFTKWRIQDNYLQLITSFAETVNDGKKVNITLQVNSLEEESEERSVEKPLNLTGTIQVKKRQSQPKEKKSTVIGAIDPLFTFDEFVVGPSNSFSHAAALAVAQSPGRAYNPLFIYGDTGLGKTHLMQAIGNKMLEQPGKTIAYVSTETFLNEYVTAIQNNRPVDFRTKYRNVDLLLIDDIQFLAQKRGIQEEFFNTFNALYTDRKQIVLTSDRPASEISGLEERLVSRFNAGLATEMECPNFETRLAILRYKQAHVEKPLKDDMLTFIAENVKSNVRSLEGAMNRAQSFSQLNNEPLTLESLKYILRDLLDKEKQEDINLDMIQKTVAEFFDIRRTDLLSTERQQAVALPRQIAMYLCRRLTHASFPEIGKSFDKTHGTVVHACNTIQGRLSVDINLKKNVRTVVQLLGKDPKDLDI